MFSLCTYRTLWLPQILTWFSLLVCPWSYALLSSPVGTKPRRPCFPAPSPYLFLLLGPPSHLYLDAFAHGEWPGEKAGLLGWATKCREAPLWPQTPQVSWKYLSALGLSVGRGAHPLQPTVLAEQLPTSLICPERGRELQEKWYNLGVKTCLLFLQQGHRSFKHFTFAWSPMSGWFSFRIFVGWSLNTAIIQDEIVYTIELNWWFYNKGNKYQKPIMA